MVVAQELNIRDWGPDSSQEALVPFKAPSGTSDNGLYMQTAEHFWLTRNGTI